MVSEHGSPLGLDGWNVFVMHTCWLHVFFMFVVYVLVVYAWWWSLLQWCHHVEDDGVIVGCIHHE